MRKLLRRATLPQRPGYEQAEILLMDIGCPHHPYVTWQRNICDGGTYWGHYFRPHELHKANADFEQRCREKGAIEQKVEKRLYGGLA